MDVIFTNHILLHFLPTLGNISVQTVSCWRRCFGFFSSTCSEYLVSFSFFLFSYFAIFTSLVVVGGAVKEDRWYLTVGEKNDKLQNKHDNLGQVNSQLPLRYLCSWIHSMTCSSFSCWLLVMRSLETLGRRAGLNFFLLPARCQRLSLIDQPAGGRRAASSIAAPRSCFISASLSLLVLLPAFGDPPVCVSAYFHHHR